MGCMAPVFGLFESWQPGCQQGFELADVGFAYPAAQRGQFQRFRHRPVMLLLQTEAGQRMAKQGGNRHGVAGAQRGFQQKRHQRTLMRGGQRRTGGIVGLDAEAREFGADAPRQIAIRRN